MITCGSISSLKCPFCKKDYSSRNSLSNHVRTFHKDAVELKEEVEPPKKTKWQCANCQKSFSCRQGKYIHVKRNVCGKQPEVTVAALQEKIKELEKKIESSPKTVINNNNTTINHTGEVNNITTTNNNNTIIRVGFGCEDVLGVLSADEKRSILNSGYSSLRKLIETVHLNNKYKQFHNVSIPNLKDKYAKCYDDSTKTFVTRTKASIVQEIIDYRASDLKDIHDELGSDKVFMHNNVLKLIADLQTYRPENGEEDEVCRFYKDIRREIILIFYNKTKLFKV